MTLFKVFPISNKIYFIFKNLIKTMLALLAVATPGKYDVPFPLMKPRIRLSC